MGQKLNNFYLAKAIEDLSKYFSLTTSEQASAQLAFQAIQGFGDRVPNRTFQEDPVTTALMDLIINTNFGAVPVFNNKPNSGIDLLRALDQLTTQTNSERATGNGRTLLQNFANTVRIYHATDFPGAPEKPWSFPVIPEMLGIGQNQGNETIRRLSAIQLNTPRITPANKYAQAISVFMNGIPTIEMTRAVPYIDVRFHFGREAIDSNGQLNATSIFKFLEGAVNVRNGSPLEKLALGNRIAGSIEGSRNNSGFLSVAGMELFTSPQTMVNGNTPNPSFSRNDTAERVVPVLDKFRPFMTFKSLTIDIAPSVGLMSFKTAKMEFILHDRSRLHEIADLIKPDLYGTTELLIEYGWSHPDPPSSGNPYAVLLNCTRIKEKYGIRNIRISFDDVGQVIINLDLFTKGVNELATESIATASEGTKRAIQNVERLSEAIRLLRERVFRNNGTENGTSSGREIRGIQILEAASDIQNNIRLSPQILNNLNDLERSLRTSRGRPEVRELLRNLRELYNTRTSSQRINTNNSNVNTGGALLQLQTSIQNEIREKLSIMNNRYDPFFPPENFKLPGGNRSDNGNAEELPISDPQFTNGPNPLLRRAGRAAIARENGAPRRNNGLPDINLSGFDNTFFSLGKLLMVFVGLPLAAQKDKFSEVQFIFYPFNAYAGYANGLNISQFMIDARFFIQEYVKFRMESLNRAGNVTLNEFMQFVSSVIIDDPGASIYGIDDLYERVRDRETDTETLRPRGNSVEFQTRLENRLRRKTPDGSFRMPSISFYVESLPRRIIGEDLRRDPLGSLTTGDIESEENAPTILRIHVFDLQTTQYDGQASLLASARDNTLSALSIIPSTNNNGEPAILENHRGTVQQIIDQARNEGIIEPIRQDPGLNSSSGARYYRIVGGANGIKNFVMKTMPYIIYGAQASNVMNASIESQNEPALSTVNMLRNLRASPIRANGEQFGGLPLSVIPMELSMTTMGCSLLSFGQQIFIDLGTGTSIDNIYGISGLQHKLSPGEFLTEIKFVPLDAYGRYSSFLERINAFVTNINDIQGSTST
jgi:hypothetical protein